MPACLPIPFTASNVLTNLPSSPSFTADLLSFCFATLSIRPAIKASLPTPMPACTAPSAAALAIVPVLNSSPDSNASPMLLPVRGRNSEPKAPTRAPFLALSLRTIEEVLKAFAVPYKDATKSSSSGVSFKPFAFFFSVSLANFLATAFVEPCISIGAAATKDAPPETGAKAASVATAPASAIVLMAEGNTMPPALAACIIKPSKVGSSKKSSNGVKSLDTKEDKALRRSDSSILACA